MVKRKKRQRVKDKFTREELVEFTFGIFLTLFMGLSTILVAAEQLGYVPIQNTVVLFVFTIGIAVGVLWLKRVDQIVERVVVTTGLSLFIIPVFYRLIFEIDVLQNPQLFVVSLCVTIIGALTVDILRED